ncbi:hypothetical protein WA026_002620 [Henosepilachna vigintioctopunctata]|uniref:Large ribosomal subunit protein mL44 n=1 Tax=Henosepilachna vigintioctopunctata TaxID=420089 RepID=A0AAW1U0W9_9CUCU
MFLIRNSRTVCNRIFTKNFNFTYAEKNIHRWVAPTLRELKRRKDQLGPEKPSPRSSFLEWNYEAELFAFGKRLGENFKRDILKQALLHSSYVHLQKQENNLEDLKDNSELIAEGSNIINQYLKDEFLKLYPRDIAESFLKYLTSDNMMAHVAKHLGLADLLLTEELPVKELTLANTLRAVVAALRLSEDLERSHLFVRDFLLTQLNGKTIFDIWEPENPIEYLNDLLKVKGLAGFEARLCNQSASNTILANYQVGLYSNKTLLGIGWGENVETAKNTAALDAISRIYNLN